MTNDAGVPGAPRFDVVLRGYDRRQVDEHVDRLQRVLSRMRADLDIARSQPMPSVNPARPAEAQRPRPTPRPRPGVGGDPDTIGTFTDRMESILAEAEAEAAEIRRNAHVSARAETDGVRSQVADLVRQRDAVLAELTRMRSQLEGMLAAPTTQMPARQPAAWSPLGRHESDGPQAQAPYSGRPAQPGADLSRGSAGPGGPPATPPPPPAGPAPAAPPSTAPQPGKSPAAAPSSHQPSSASPSNKPPAAPSSHEPSSNNGAPTTAVPSAAPSAGAASPPRPQEPATPPPSAGSAPAVEPGSDKAHTLPSKLPGPAAAPGQPTRSERETGKAAHRLPTGAYPAVQESGSSSLRPRTEPQIEPADLFRSNADGRPEPRTTAVPHPPAGDTGAPGADRTAMVPTVRPGGDEERPAEKSPKPLKPAASAEATTVVGAVRPDSPTVLAPTPGPVTRPDKKDDETNGDAQSGSTRSGSSSRSG